jgi:prepilin-type N-terminal cleavage/methylation domain-containing protein
MVPKYTILKVIIQNFSRTDKASKGFTLIELIVGLSIMLIVGGLAMNALIQASISFNKDKKSIDSSQSMSAILEIIGNDIRQAGEGINDSNFPTIEFKVDTASTANTALNVTNPQKSSIVTIRKSVSPQLTLCQNIPGDGTALPGQINVADTTGSADTNCKFTAAAPTLFPPSGVTISPFSTLISTRESMPTRPVEFKLFKCN